jgi:enoyl ACP reductase
MLDGKRIVVTGALTRDSIAFAVAELAQRVGAEIVLTGFGRGLRMTERIARKLPDPSDVLELDVNEPAHHEALRAELEARWGSVDGVLHAIAYAPADAIGAEFVDTPATSAEEAFLTSAYSLKALTETLQPLLAAAPGGRASVVGLDFDASVAWPAYNWMGVAKAALEAVSRYLAYELGPSGVRVNLVSAGPLATVAAQGIAGFSDLASQWGGQAPLGWDVEDKGPVARAVCFLLSDLARGVSGEIFHVDGGRHAMGAALAGATAG